MQEKHITQRELASALYLAPSTINGYLQSRRLPDCETLVQIALYLDTSVDYLLGTTSVSSRQLSAEFSASGIASVDADSSDFS
ncbi:MAG: helix-turn-helix transcriptional regulator [Roseburia sp.]|nr:helix-turn-helix transcriptional regulator [Roseburia sp.]